MKLVVKREPLTAALVAAAAVVPLRGVRPSLKNALLMPSADGTLEIRATDMEVGLRYRVKAESIERPVAVCLPCKTFADVLSLCTDDVVTLETHDTKATLTAGRDRFELLGQEADDFPEVPDMGDGTSLSLPAAEFSGMIDRTVFAAAREQGRYAINGVYMQCKENRLEVVATDGRRLALCKATLAQGGALEEGVIVPVKMMQEVRKLCELAGEETVQMGLRGRTIVVRGGPLTLSSLVVEGIYPKYQQVIPKDTDKDVTFKLDQLAMALRKAMLLTSEETKVVEFTFSPGTCLIESRSPDKGHAAVPIECEYTGEKLSVGYQPHYLNDALKVLAGDTVRLELKDHTRPGVLREGQDYLYVLMPVNPKG